MATIADQPDIEVVGEVQNENDLADIVEQVQPEVLIIAMDETESSTPTLARDVTICSNMSGSYDPDPTTRMSSFLDRMRSNASRSSRFSASKKLSQPAPEILTLQFPSANQSRLVCSPHPETPPAPVAVFRFTAHSQTLAAFQR